MEIIVAREQLARKKREDAARLAARKAEDRERGYATTPTYRYNPKLGQFVERPVWRPPAQPRRLEINGHLYSWPELAGETSGRAIRRAAQVWNAAKDFYGLSDLEATNFASSRMFDGSRFYTFAEYARARAERGIPLNETARAWVDANLRLPPNWSEVLTQTSARERGENARADALARGFVHTRPLRERRVRVHPQVEGDFRSTLPWETGQAAAVRRVRVGGEPVFGPEPEVAGYFSPEVTPKFARPRQTELEPGQYPTPPRPLSDIPPEISETRYSGPQTPATRGGAGSFVASPKGPLQPLFYAGARRPPAETEPEPVFDVLPAPRRRQVTVGPEAQTILAIKSPNLSPIFEGEVVRPQPARRMTAAQATWIFAFPEQARSQTGPWRFEGGSKIPELEIVRSTKNEANVRLGRDERKFVFWMFDNGWIPKRNEDFLSLKSGGDAGNYSVVVKIFLDTFIKNLPPITEEDERSQGVGRSYVKTRRLTTAELDALAAFFRRAPLDPDNWRGPVDPAKIPGFPTYATTRR